ncbi:MAG TPA: TonB-dependent receptor, partial [Acidobacteriaceae bacterium]|nr:TonB-dependent receptor [Acidobacteriaceae bacterium]
RTSSTTSPGILIPSVALFGSPHSVNDRQFETHVEFSDSFSIQHRGHLLQAGARIDHVALRADTPDGSRGLFVFPTLAAYQAGAADFFTQSFGNFRTNFAEMRIAAYAQDHWTAGKRLTLDYGLRYDSSLLPAPVPRDTLNLSPRVGAAFTLTGSLVVRAGFGVFFDRYLLCTINRVLELNGSDAFTQTAEDTAAATLYRSDSSLQAPVPAVAPSIWRAQPNLRNPYSEVASLSLEQSLPFQSTVTGEYQFVRGVHLGRATNINLAPPVTLSPANAASLNISSPTPQQLGLSVFSPTRLNPAYDAINQFATSASSTYNGATLTLNRQFQKDFELMAGYTFSKTIDNASSDTEQPQNPFNLAAERALSLQDQRHRFTLSGLWLIGPDVDDPADATKNANPSPLMKALTGLEFAPILTVSSGFRTNPIVGLDSNREHIFPFAARPTGYARNSLATPTQINLDLRILRIVPLGRGHLDIVGESFNLLNHPNVALINPVFGSGAQPAASFGRPMSSFPARHIQFSLDYEF